MIATPTPILGTTATNAKPPSWTALRENFVRWYAVLHELFLHCLTPCSSFATMTCAPSAYGRWNPAPCPSSHLKATWRLSWLQLSNPPCPLLVTLASHRLYPAPYCPGSHLKATWRPSWLCLLSTHPHCLLLVTLVGHPCFLFFLCRPRLLKCPTKYCSMPLLHLRYAPPADRMVV